MRYLVTGSAGFIGSSVVRRLLNKGCVVFGVDDHNSYYDPRLKEDRLKLNEGNPNYTHHRADISDKERLSKIFHLARPDVVINLAAQAGVRYSIENPDAYIQSNIVGFANVLEECRRCSVQHLLYASSSSVYGANTKIPFSTGQNVDHPLSLYAASKKSNELMAHTYSHLFGLPTTGLRFFTVYGPWGRPDMALFKFTRSILAGEQIEVFNFGDHKRDFTYVDDVVDAVVGLSETIPTGDNNWSSDSPHPATSRAPYQIFNIGNSEPVQLLDFISILENKLNKKARIELLPMQQGDVPNTFADVSDLEVKLGYKPKTTVAQGISNFVDWYLEYFQE